MSAVISHDPYLDLPLHGVQLIEASAGTGKTYTLATLVTRLVVEQGLRVGEILAVTFTEAATQELRKRIRLRLQLALALLDAPVAEAESAEAKLTRQLLAAHRANSGESDEALRRRLRQAVAETDLAAVFTIHGFCARVLREHALEFGRGFDAPELLANDRDLREELAADLWRTHAQDDDGAADLVALWSGGHEAFAADLPALLREPVLLPPPLWESDGGIAAALADLRLAETGLQRAWNMDGDAFFERLSDAIAGDVMNRTSYKPEWVVELRAWLQIFVVEPARAGKAHPKLEKITREALEKGTKQAHVGKTPISDGLDAAVVVYLDAAQRVEDALTRRRAMLLHVLRAEARARLALLKQQRRVQTYDDLIDGVADALAGDNGDALARELRQQYRVALVDEFQDTDARQWAIFKRVFGEDDPALFLIGDPKQAIYGFRGGDVHTYLAASEVATPAPPLSHNFRSRPSLLASVEALYANAQAAFDAGQIDAPPFIDKGIQFHPVQAGDKRADGDYRRDGVAAPALTLWQAPPTDEFNKQGEPTAWSAGESRDLATRACVAAIHAVLSEARAGTATLQDKDALRPVRPGDIAVLVRSHGEATRIQRALALFGIPAVAAGKQSLFATDEARDLHALLLALLHSGDDGRLRTALATVLVGVDATGIDALDHPGKGSDATAHRDWQAQATRWRERLLRGGPLALVDELCAANGARLLGLLDGERRLSNYLQLAELLQEAQQRALGLHGLVEWLGHAIATADPDDETQLLRLESDAQRVQIVTLHKSKGLEYPLVFLPFVGIGRLARSPERQCVVHDEEHGRRLHWKLDLPEAGWKDAKEAWQREQRAEDARLLYVGLTRAEHALWIATGPFFAHDKAALAPMLGDGGALQRHGVLLDATPAPLDLPRLPPESEAEVPSARPVTRKLDADWWVHSFSQLAKADAGTGFQPAEGGSTASAATLPAAGGNDEPEPADEAVDAAFDPRFAGNRYGVALHAALEHADFAAWHDWREGDDAPVDEAGVIEDALRGEGYGDDSLDEGIALTTRLIGHTLTVALPEGVRLCDVPASERRPEIEFQFALQPTRVDALLRLLHAHGIVRERDRFGMRQRLEGLMTGLIDLTYRHEGKWYVLDYKSNRLPGYDAAQLMQAMAHSEYDLQALIYTLALHRWLRFRVGDAYEYERDFGGIRYLFCRGLDASRSDSPGIHAQRFTPELVHDLDALFSGQYPPLPLAGEGWGEGPARVEIPR